MKIGIVFGTFAPMHLGHMDVINIAREEMDKVVVVCCGHEGDRGYPAFPLDLRLKLVSEEFADDEKVFVTSLVDTDPEIKKHWNQQQIWNYWVERMLLMLFMEEFILAGDEVFFYTSEPDYAELLTNSPHKINVHLCERIRKISGTMIREDMAGYFDQMVSSYQEHIRNI